MISCLGKVQIPKEYRDFAESLLSDWRKHARENVFEQNALGEYNAPDNNKYIERKIANYNSGTQVHDMMLVSYAPEHYDHIEEQKQSSIVIPVITNGKYILEQGSQAVKLKRGHVYRFNQYKTHSFYYGGDCECYHNPSILLVINFYRKTSL